MMNLTSRYFVAGDEGFYSSDPKYAPPILTLKKKVKFENKFLVWLFISPRGIASALIKPSGNSISRTMYIKDY